jgi:hypothetical protein
MACNERDDPVFGISMAQLVDGPLLMGDATLHLHGTSRIHLAKLPLLYDNFSPLLY